MRRWGAGGPWLTATPSDVDGRLGPAPSVGWRPAGPGPWCESWHPGPAPTEVCPKGGQLSLRLLQGKKGWLITEGTQKGGQAGGRAHHGVERILDPGKVQAPGGGVAGGDTMQGRLQSLVSPFRLPVGLGMVSR